LAAGACDGCGVAQGVDRRAFLSVATLAAVAAVLESCGIPTAPVGGTGGTIVVKVADFPALAATGGVARVDNGGSPTALVRSGASSFAAFSMVCTHQGTTINITSTGFLCPNHSARFGKDGLWEGGQFTSALVSFPVAFDGAAGTVTIARPA
jgi:Rieske Fe-S protein